ncbi:MAG: transposase [Gemmatales bacterium]|nr:transposase [Gemmatales bacterium]
MAELALAVAGDELPAYWRPKSPRRLTQPQLFACLVLRAHRKQTYRGIADLLAASDDLRRALGLTRVPDYSTLQRFAVRAITPGLVDRLLGRLIERVGPVIDAVAMDATGMEPSNASAYYTARRGTRPRGYMKLSVVVVCGCLLPLALVVRRGPRHDPYEAEEVMDWASEKVRPRRLYADVGYDAERVHRFCFEVWKVRSYAPPVMRREAGTLGG